MAETYSLFVFVTSECNFYCSYCYEEYYGGEEAPSVMTKDTARQTVDWLTKELLKTNIKKVEIVFFGGEPLLNFPVIEYMVEYAEDEFRKISLDVIFSIVTNGSITSKRIFDFCCTHNIRLALSLDGNRVSHDLYRKTKNGEGTFDIIENNVWTQEFIKKRNDISVLATFTPESVNYLFENMKFFKKKGLKRMTFNAAVEPQWQWNDEKVTLLEEQCQYISDYLEDNLFHRKDYHFFSVAPFMPLLKNIDRMEKLEKKPIYPIEIRCTIGRYIAAISPDGSIHLCPKLVKSDPIKRTKVEVGTVSRGITNPQVIKWIRDLKPLVSKQSKCSSCEIAQACQTHCVAANYISSTDPYEIHPNFCNVSKTYYKVFKKLYDKLAREKNPVFKRILNGEYTEFNTSN